jgi:hypothetical protein
MITGLLPDKPDRRDVLLRKVVKPEAIPDRVDLRPFLLPVRSQGDEGVCVGFAAAGMKEFQEVRDCGLDEHLSPRYIYAECKRRDGYPGEEGTSLRVAMGVLLTNGVCLERSWPYAPHRPGRRADYADDEANGFRINSYAKLTTALDMEKCLSGNGPFCLGLDIWPGWMKVGADGIIPDPPRRYESMGGHAVLICRYDRRDGYFQLRNTWGDDWGSGGYGWINYRHVLRCLISAWSSVDMPGSLLPEVVG